MPYGQSQGWLCLSSCQNQHLGHAPIWTLISWKLRKYSFWPLMKSQHSAFPAVRNKQYLQNQSFNITNHQFCKFGTTEQTSEVKWALFWFCCLDIQPQAKSRKCFGLHWQTPNPSQEGGTSSFNQWRWQRGESMWMVGTGFYQSDSSFSEWQCAVLLFDCSSRAPLLPPWGVMACVRHVIRSCRGPFDSHEWARELAEVALCYLEMYPPSSEEFLACLNGRIFVILHVTFPYGPNIAVGLACWRFRCKNLVKY